MSSRFSETEHTGHLENNLKKKNERETSEYWILMQTFLACIQVQDCKDGERSPVNQHSRHQDCSSSL